MNVKILSDSTCDLSQDILKAHNISLIPLTVIKDGKEFKDGVSITPSVIFDHVAVGGALCTTSANSVGEYAEQFAKYAEDFDGVLHINIGSGFSSCSPPALSCKRKASSRRCIRTVQTQSSAIWIPASSLAVRSLPR